MQAAGSRGTPLPHRMAWIAAAVVLLAGCSGPPAPLPDPGPEPLPDTRSAWLATAPLPHPLTATACAFHQGEAWLLGGINDKNVTQSSVYVYNPDDDEWRRDLALPAPIHGGSAASHRGRLLHAGGFVDRAGNDETPTASIYELQAFGFWSSLDSLPEPRAKGTLIAAQDLYYLGGHNPDNDVWRWGGIFGDWAPAGILNESRARPAVTWADGLHVIGGDARGTMEFVGEEESTLIEGGLDVPRHDFQWADIGGLIVIAGGLVGNDASPIVDFYETETDHWIPGPILPHGIHNGCMVAGTDGLYLMGGETATGATDQVWFLPWRA